MMLAPAFAMPIYGHKTQLSRSHDPYPTEPPDMPDEPDVWEKDDQPFDAHNHDWEVFMGRLLDYGFPDDYPVDSTAWVVVKRGAAEHEARRWGYELTPGDVVVEIDMPKEAGEGLVGYTMRETPDDVWNEGIPLDDIAGYATVKQQDARETEGAKWVRR
jgi:hypothetical protein